MQDGPRSGGLGPGRSYWISPSGRHVGDRARPGGPARKPARN